MYSLYSDINELYDIIQQPNPNLITFICRWVTFLEKCGDNNKPLKYNMGKEEFQDLRKVLIGWYKNQNEKKN